jgi:hypothetical protein
MYEVSLIYVLFEFQYSKTTYLIVPLVSVPISENLLDANDGIIDMSVIEYREKYFIIKEFE